MCFERLLLIAFVMSGGSLFGRYDPKWEVWLSEFAESRGVLLKGETLASFGDSFQERVEFVHYWAKELENCPPLSDADRLPHPATRRRNLCLAKAHSEWAEKQSQLPGVDAADWYPWCRDAKTCHTFWDRLSDDNLKPGNSHYHRLGRWQLAKIRGLIGRDAYNRGDWPEPYPTKYFEEHPCRN